MSQLLAPFRKARRLVWIMLAWSNRHLLGLWFRSLRAEMSQPFDLGRTSRLVRSLIKVSGDSRLSNTPELRSMRIVDDALVAETDPSWKHRATVRSVLQGVARINRVEFDDSMGPAATSNVVSTPAA